MSANRQPACPPPGRIVTLGVHAVMPWLLMSRLFRAKDWTLAPMVQPIDARSTATEDRVPSSRLIDLRKVHHKKIFVQGSHAWKVHKLKGSSSTTDRYWHSTPSVLTSRRCWGDPRAGPGAALRRYYCTRMDVMRSHGEARGRRKTCHLQMTSLSAGHKLELLAILRSGILAFFYIICATLEVLLRYSHPALIP